MRLAVYSDFGYRRGDDGLWAEFSFVRFASELERHCERVVLVGRLVPGEGRWHSRVPDEVDFVPLPYYPTLARPGAAARAMWRSVVSFSRALDGVDVVWLLGPHPLSVAFALVARLRRRRVVLGVRQDLRRYVRHRRPRRIDLRVAAALLEAAFRLLGRHNPVVAVGPDLARQYRGAPKLLELTVSLVREAEVADPRGTARSWDGEIRVLSVGRVDAEKNPLMLADVLARLRASGFPCTLIVCGDGAMYPALARRLQELHLEEHAHLLGYVADEQRLSQLYRESHVFLHVSWTEGVPQVLFEAFAAGLPIVATAVGGVSQAVGEAALLVPPGDPEAPARAISLMARDEQLRRRLAAAGTELVRSRTLEAEAARLAGFLEGAR